MVGTHDGGLNVSDGRRHLKWYGCDPLRVDEYVEAVRERDSLACGDKGLGFDGFVALARKQ